MSYETTFVHYKNNWGGQNYYKKETYIPPPTVPYQPQKSSSSVYVPSSSSGGGGGGRSTGGSDNCIGGCLMVICGLFFVASIVFMVLIPNYPDTFPIGFIAIPASCLGIMFLAFIYNLCGHHLECCCSSRKGFVSV